LEAEEEKQNQTLKHLPPQATHFSQAQLYSFTS